MIDLTQMRLDEHQPNIIGNVEDPMSLEHAAMIPVPHSSSEDGVQEEADAVMDGFRDITSSMRRLDTRRLSKSRTNAKR